MINGFSVVCMRIPAAAASYAVIGCLSDPRQTSDTPARPCAE